MSVFGLRWCEWCRWGVCRDLTRVWRSGWCYVCVSSESGFSLYMAGPGICILFLTDSCTSYVHPMFNPVAPYEHLLSTVYLFMTDIAIPNLFVCACRTWIYLYITRFYEEQRQYPSGPHGQHAQKIVNQAHIVGGGRLRHNLYRSL